MISRSISPHWPAVRRAVPASLAALSLAAGGWLAAPAALAHASSHASSHSQGTRLVIGSDARVSQSATLAYWTLARLRAAKPLGLLDAGAAPAARPASARPAGRPGSVAGGMPGGASLAAAPAPSAAPSPDAFSYPFPDDSFTPPQKLWKTYPYRVNGKLFLTNGGGNYVCSATSVASAHGTSDEDEIWTAGHCLVNTEAANQVVDSKALFIPAYNGNKTKEKNYAPYGKFVWTGAWETSTAWYDNRDFTEDEAAMTVRRSSARHHHTLGQAVGWDGFAWNFPVNEQFVVFGYPAAAPYNGKNLIEDIAATAGQDSMSGADATEPIVIGNPMSPGSSGGAWDIDWTATRSGYIDGHNDYKYSNEPLAMYSPYQDSISNQVRCLGASSC